MMGKWVLILMMFGAEEHWEIQGVYDTQDECVVAMDALDIDGRDAPADVGFGAICTVWIEEDD